MSFCITFLTKGPSIQFDTCTMFVWSEINFEGSQIRTSIVIFSVPEDVICPKRIEHDVMLHLWHFIWVYMGCQLTYVCFHFKKLKYDACPTN